MDMRENLKKTDREKGIATQKGAWNLDLDLANYDLFLKCHF